jgi:hypothetical protein
MLVSAHYAEFEVVIEIDDLSVARGTLPPSALGLLVEWATLHQAELLEVWSQAQTMQTLSKIAPLE